VISTPNKGSTFSFIIENKDQVLSDKFQSDDLNDLNDSSRVPEEFGGNFTPISFPTLKAIDAFSNPIIPIETCSCPEILIVDDNPFNTMTFEAILSSLDIKCDPANGGSSAIEKLLAREKRKCGTDC